MNKTLILFLVICIISVHAFVRRDAPEASTDDTKNAIEKLLKDLNDAFKGAKDQVEKSLDSETLKKGFNDFVDTAKKTIDGMKPTEAPKGN